MSQRSLQLALAAVCLSALAAAGCSHSPTHVRIPPVTAPVPDSPQHAVDLLRWCWEHRSVSDYQNVTTEDFVFVFRDSFGLGGYRSLTRDEELTAAPTCSPRGRRRFPRLSVLR